MNMLGDNVDYTKVIFGQNAMRAASRLVLQDAGMRGGKHVTMVVGYLVSDQPLLSTQAREIASPHELIVGDLMIRPHQKATGHNFVGHGLEAITTSDAFGVDAWDHQSFPVPE